MDFEVFKGYVHTIQDWGGLKGMRETKQSTKTNASPNNLREKKNSYWKDHFLFIKTLSSSLLVLHAQNVCHSNEDWKDHEC